MARRISAYQPCRMIGCEGFTVEGSRFCVDCNEARAQKPPPRPVRPGERDVDIVLLKEAVRGGGPYTARVKRFGTSSCQVCDGPCLSGRSCCSDICRGRALHEGAGLTIVLDGIEAKPLAHAKRLGISNALFYKRRRSGASVHEALTRPIDREMRRRAMCRESGGAAG